MIRRRPGLRLVLLASALVLLAFPVNGGAATSDESAIDDGYVDPFKSE